MNEKPTISICIANYNGMEMIDDCIRSVLAQTGIDSDEVEIIVHDDASTDGSVAHIRANYPTVKLIESTKNMGFCVANNRMAEAARGDYLLLLNNDAALFPNALATLYQDTQEQGQPSILGLPQYDDETGELLDIGSRLDPFLNPVPNLNPSLGEVGLVMGACLWMPARLWRSLNGFPTWIGSIGEDLYLCCLARLQGVPVRCLGTSGYRHRVGNSFGGGKISGGRLSTTRRRRALSERNKTCVILICMPRWQLTLTLPLHLLLLHLEGLLLTLLLCDGALWRQVYGTVLPEIWRLRGTLLAARHVAQAHRRVGWVTWQRVFHWWPWKLTLLWRHGLPTVR